MKILISGGCKNGKSYYAQRVCRALGGNLCYIATMIAADDEDRARIENHRKERDGWGFVTIEQPRDIEKARFCAPENATVLLDSLTALLANEMFCPVYTEGAREKAERGLMILADRVANIVVVSDYVYSDAARYDGLTEEYRKSLALVERKLAARFDSVVEVSYSGIIYHKGDPIEVD